MFLLYLMIGVGVLVVVLGVMNAAAKASPRTLANGIKIGAGVGGGMLALWLLLTGRIGPALAILSFFAPLQSWMRRIFTQAGNAGSPSPEQSSDVETPYLRMSLDHDTGAIEGTVLRGRFSGRRLSELPAGALLNLLAELRISDNEGATLLEAYLDRVHPDWRDGPFAQYGQSAPSSAGMTREEAYRILGVEPGAGERQIRDAHRRLMLKLHPDQGGSDYLAAKINQAKDLLLGG